MSKGLVIFDRDGTLNSRIHGSYVLSAEDIVIPDDLNQLSMLTQSGFQIAIATNQSCISKNLITHSQVLMLTQMICQPYLELNSSSIYVCPHVVTDYCMCRKPKPGLINRILADQANSVSNIFMVGDMQSDYQAAKAADIDFVGVCWDGECTGLLCRHTLTNAITWIIERSST